MTSSADDAAAIAEDRVLDEEILYRRVLDNPQHYTIEGKVVRVSASAFSDRHRRPSVDRKAICGGPEWTQESPENGVVRITAGAVRGIGDLKSLVEVAGPPKSKSTTTYKVDVVPAPVKDEPSQRDNAAHAEIRSHPNWVSDSAFKRLLERLARIAATSWEILPRGARNIDPGR